MTTDPTIYDVPTDQENRDAQRDEFGDRLFKALCRYRIPTMVFEDDLDCLYTLKDLMTPDGETVDKGEEALRDLADYLVGELSH